MKYTPHSKRKKFFFVVGTESQSCGEQNYFLDTDPSLLHLEFPVSRLLGKELKGNWLEHFYRLKMVEIRGASDFKGDQTAVYHYL